MSSILTGVGNVVGGVSATVSVTPAQPAQTPSTPTPTPTPADATAVLSGTSKAQWAMVAGQTIYVSARAPFGPSPWVPWTVAYVWPDGDAILVCSGKQALRTDLLRVVFNLRRAGEVYPDDAAAGALP